MNKIQAKRGIIILESPIGNSLDHAYLNATKNSEFEEGVELQYVENITVLSNIGTVTVSCQLKSAKRLSRLTKKFKELFRFH